MLPWPSEKAKEAAGSVTWQACPPPAGGLRYLDFGAQPSIESNEVYKGSSTMEGKSFAGAYPDIHQSPCLSSMDVKKLNKLSKTFFHIWQKSDCKCCGVRKTNDHIIL